MSLQAQVETLTGRILAIGQFTADSPDPETIEIVTLTDEQEAAVLADEPGQRVLGEDGEVTITPPPPIEPPPNPWDDFAAILPYLETEEDTRGALEVIANIMRGG